MLQALTRFFRRGHDAAQLDLGLEQSVPRDAGELLARLRQLGLRKIERAKLTHNRNVMVSFGRGELRVHEGFLDAPEGIHRAIVRLVEARTRAERRAAQRVIVAHPVATTPGPSRKERTHTDDEASAAKFMEWHGRYNARHFLGRLTPVQVRVSRRMKSRLGHYSAASAHEPAEIAISRRHLRRNGWAEALHTLLHEMVHQWQDESGYAIDHGKSFRAKCREIGIAPCARRAVILRSGATKDLLFSGPATADPSLRSG